MKPHVPALWILCLLLSGCLMGKDSPPDLIKEDTYINLMVEMQLVKILQESVPPDSNVTDSLIPKVFEKYNVTKEQFKRSHNYYQQQISAQQRRIDEAIERLRKDMYTDESGSGN